MLSQFILSLAKESIVVTSFSTILSVQSFPPFLPEKVAPKVQGWRKGSAQAALPTHSNIQLLSVSLIYLQLYS